MAVFVWASLMASWFSPSSLFLFLNLTIGTIFLMNRFGTRRNPEYQQLGQPYDSPQLARATSLLDRVRSVNFSLYKFEPPSEESELHNLPEPDRAAEYPTQLVRTPSWLERLKSIKLSRSEQPERETFRPDSSPEFNDHAAKHPAQLVRTPSMLERLKSIKLNNSESHDPKPEPESFRPHPSPEFHDHSMKRSQSDPVSEVTTKAEKMTKSASEKSAAVGGEADYGSGEEEIDAVEIRRPATTGVDQTATSLEDDGVDAKADDFINKFNHQLKLQRLASLKRFSEMWRGK